MEGQRSLESFGYEQELHRSVATVDLLIYGLVFMVPIAPWAIFGTVYNSASGMVPLVYLIGLIAHGAMGTMNTSPYTSRSTVETERLSSWV